ncbi:mitochondrial import inner membrane translocase subunit TIM44 [Polistes fuscatus]|uniref:mitochondrial import inner membrane translocase subunit TIM44 n=1 Tax=Polistes fuscatus TaxID=30207 RepID=UPI001CAA12E6|nr:mitochondrial import inner membrane translocase subunit TIM44 [Polistes fuscatus]
MFQNFVTYRISLVGIARSTQSQRRFRNGSRENSLSCNPLLHTTCFHLPDIQSSPIRWYSNPARRPSFFTQFVENIKQEMQKNKEMKESLKKFREEAEKLEQSEALRSARQKFQAVESEASKSSEVIKEKLDTLKEKVQEVIEEASKSELGKKAGQIGEEISKSAKEAAETISEKSQALGKTGAFQTISQTAEVVRNELDHHGMQGRVYVPLTKLRKRKEVAEISLDEKQVKPNMEALGVELHKDSKFFQSWQKFKDNNPYMNKVLDWKIKYDESENPVIRASRFFTEKVSDVVGGMFRSTDLSETLTEICKLDPSFDKNQFLRDCEVDIIPNILEAMVRGDLEILKDWCHQAPYNLLSQPIIQVQKLGYHFDNKILDIENVDLRMGKMMEQGPVLLITFQSQQIFCIRNKDNSVVEGDPERVMRFDYVWVLCRDPMELNPKAAWRLLDLSISSTNQFV